MNQYKKRINKTAAVLLLVCLLLNAGCWDRREIEKLALTQAAGVDYQPEEDQIVYTSLIARPGQLAAGVDSRGEFFMGPVWVAQATGKTIFEAFLSGITKSPRFLFESHIMALIVGEELARRGIGELVDFTVREREHRLLYPFIITRGKASEIIRAEPQLESSIAQEIRNVLEEQRELSTAPIITIKDFINNLNLPGADAFSPVIEIRRKTSPPEEEFISTAGEKTEKFIAVQGTAVFSRDKLAGYLNVPETKGLLWVHEKIVRTVITPIQTNGGQVIVYITRGSSRLEPEFTENGLKMYIQIQTEGDIASAAIKQDLTDPLFIEELEKSLANHIKQEILLAVAKSREYKSDFLHFGAAFRRKDPKKWKKIEENWREMLTEVEVEVRVMAEIRRTGLIFNPILLK